MRSAGVRNECLFNKKDGHMTFTTKAASTLIGLASATLAVAASLTPANAADLNGPRGGSIKDSGYEAPRSAPRGPSGPCYFRGDAGYSWSNKPDLSWPVSNYAAGPPVAYNYVGDSVTNTKMDNTWFGDVGLGCGMGSYGIREIGRASCRERVLMPV